MNLLGKKLLLSRPLLNSHGKEKGFTLMESLAVLGVMALLLVLVIQVFMVSINSYRRLALRANNDTDAILTARIISEAVRGASEVLTTATINGTLYTSSDEELVVRLPSITAEGNIIDGQYDYLSFYRDNIENTKIFSDTQIGIGSSRPSGKKLIASSNELMIFRYNNPDISSAQRVSIYLLNSRSDKESTVSTKAWTSIFIRNH